MKDSAMTGALPKQTVQSFSLSGIRKEQINAIIVYFFILLFTYAGLRKLIDLEMFVKEIWGFALFGSMRMVRMGFVLLSCAELIVALMLTIPRTRQLGIYGAFVLMVTINILFFIMQQYAKVIPLYFGGIIPAISFIAHFIFNMAVLFVALIGVLLSVNSREVK